MRFKALKLQKASAVQKLIPLTTLFQWVFDVTIFSVHYTYWQDGALIYLCLLYVFQGLKYMCYDAKKKEETLIEKARIKKSILLQSMLQSDGQRPFENNTERYSEK